MLAKTKKKNEFLSGHATLLQKLRDLMMDNQQKARDSLISKSRGLDFLLKSMDEEVSTDPIDIFSINLKNSSQVKENVEVQIPLHELKIEEEEQKETKKDRKDLRKKQRKYAKIFTFPEYLFEIPSDLTPQEWYIVPKPEGIRCLLITRGGATYLRNKDGFVVKKFESDFPGGKPKKKHGATILDIIYDKNREICYFLDILLWNDQQLIDCSAEARYFWLDFHAAQVKHDESLALKFCNLQRFACNVEGFKTAYSGNFFFDKDGLLFVAKAGTYISGVSPYVLFWKDCVCSLYFITNQMSETIVCFLEMNAEKQLKTLDNFILKQLCEEEIVKFQMKKGEVFKVEIKEDSISDINFMENNRVFLLNNVVVVEKTIKKALPEPIGKILYRYHAKNHPLTASDIYAHLEKFPK